MSGYEVARRARQARAPGREAPLVVALSGYADAEARRRSAEAGVDLHLAKPADPAALLDLLAGLSWSAGAG